MLNYQLEMKQVTELREAHRRALNVREAYRINAVILLSQGWKPVEVAKALLLDEDSVRTYFKRYNEGGIKELLRMSFAGGEALLNAEQLGELDRHLKEEMHRTADSVVRWVKARWGICYAVSGMTTVLHRLGDVCKKAKLVPGKANRAKQEAFLKHHEAVKEIQAQKGDPIYFVDAVHPQHNPVVACGWIPRGEVKPIPSNTGRRRLNINGALDVQRCCGTFALEDVINAASAIALFQQLEEVHPKAERIVVICDNARYYRAKAVNAFLETSRVQVEFLPAYSPNLNLIERFWKYFKSQLLYNRYYETFDQFKKTCQDFLKNLDPHVPRPARPPVHLATGGSPPAPSRRRPGVRPSAAGPRAECC